MGRRYVGGFNKQSIDQDFHGVDANSHILSLIGFISKILLLFRGGLVRLFCDWML